jgi:hypothetical protein
VEQRWQQGKAEQWWQQGKAVAWSCRGSMGKRRRQQGRKLVSVYRLSLSLSLLYLSGGWLGLKRVGVGPAEMGLMGLRFKAGKRRYKTYGL